ncbi:MAG: PilZ domain-containing protein [Candidatus Acidiferrales bacterium]
MKPALDPHSENASSEDRRKHARYRFSAPITVRTSDGASISSMSVEISQSGMSIATTAALRSGDTLEIEPVGGGKASAIIRHRQGNFYGVEFISIADNQVEQIKDTCRMLPKFRTTSLDI